MSGAGSTGTYRSRSARPAGCEAGRPLWLLRHHGELHAAATVLPTGHQDMAEMAGTPLAQEGAPLGEILADPGAPPASPTEDHAALRRCQRSSLMRNRMQ